MTTAETWAQRITEWRHSGRSSAVYCAGKGFRPSALFYWVKRLRVLEARGPSRPEIRIARVVPQTPTEAATRSSATVSNLVITIGNTRIEVTGGCDAHALSALLKSLRVSA
jgi:hypothetical protein